MRRETYRVTATQRLDIQECKDLVILEEFKGRDVACNSPYISLMA